MTAADRGERSLTAGERRQLDQTVELLRDVLGPDLVAAYLYGSAMIGGLQPRSDLDVFAVSKRPTTRDEKRRLVDLLFVISGDASPQPPRPIELTIVVHSDVRPWRYPPKFDFQYGEWLRGDFEKDVEPWPTTTDGDLASLIRMIVVAHEPLFGPPAGDVLDAVPREDYVRAMVDEIDGLLRELQADTRNVILTLARIWSTVATDAVHSKVQAADWALARLPEEHRAVLARARAICVGEEDERWDDVSESIVRAHAEYVVDEIKKLVERGS